MKDFIYPSITPSSIPSVVWNEKIYNKIVDDMRHEDEAWDKNRLRQLPNLHLNVDYIYKYRAFDPEAKPSCHDYFKEIEQLFVDKTLWSPSLEKLNDPLEAAFVFKESVVDFEIANAVAMMLTSNWYGCICFTRDPVCVQMWAHYALSHQGYCVEYYRPSSVLLSLFSKPVLYRKAMPELTSKDFINNSTTIIDNLFWTKSEAWEYEAEWRLRYPRANGPTAPNLIKPHGVIFGLRTKESTKNFIRDCAGNIRFGQIVPSREPYRIKVKWE